MVAVVSGAIHQAHFLPELRTAPLLSGREPRRINDYLFQQLVQEFQIGLRIFVDAAGNLDILSILLIGRDAGMWAKTRFGSFEFQICPSE